MAGMTEAKMSPGARRAAVRLLLGEYRREVRLRADNGSTSSGAYPALEQLSGPLDALATVKPKRYALVRAYIVCGGSPESALSAELVTALEETCDWLAARIEADVIDLGEWTDLLSKSPFEIPDNIARELEYAIERSSLAAERERDGMESDPDADEPDTSYRPITPEDAYKENAGQLPDHEGYELTTEKGPSGAPVGRPRVGTAKPAAAVELAEQGTGLPIAELRACLRPGNQTAEAEATRAVLIPWLRQIRAEKRATTTALAAALECGESTIRRLVAK
jgi:hypothetical protein